jgi:hypothetical protein
MKNNSNWRKISLVILSMLTITLACKDNFLEVPPTGSLANAQLATKAGVEGALIGTYSMLTARGYSRYAAPNNWVFGNILGGDSNKGTDPGDYSSINTVQRYETEATQPDLNQTWQAKYEAISRANATLRLASQAKDISAADLKRIQGETRFLRGHFYFDLKKIWNSVPYIDETKDYGTGIEKVPNSPNFWDKIEADLKFAYDNLPETQAQAGRVNKWAAGAMLAKAYLFQKKFAEAKALFDVVIANGKTTNGKKYGLVSNFAQIFNAANDNHEESVFAVQTAMNTGSTNNSNWFDDLNYPYNTGTDGPGNCCGFNQPSFDAANAFRTNANGLPLLDGSYNDKANELKHDYNVESSAPFTPDAGNVDPRLDHSIGRRGIPYLDWIDHPGKNWIRNQPYAGPYSPKKYVYYKSQENTLTDGSSWTRGYATMNYTVIRFGDVLLMAAECEAELGNLEAARALVNQIRARAANPASWVKKKDGSNAANYVIGLYNTPWTDKASAINAVRFERRLELSQEGHRFFDLVRWGVASDVLNKYLAHEAVLLTTKFGGAKFIAGREFLPIPQAQIDIQGADVLKQNPSY